MTDFVSVPLRLPNNTLIQVEPSVLRPQADKDVAFKSVEDTLHIDSIQGAIEGIGQMVIGSLRTLAPSRATAEFGIEVGLESGQLTALWVKGTGKANLKITLEWRSDTN